MCDLLNGCTITKYCCILTTMVLKKTAAVVVKDQGSLFSLEVDETVETHKTKVSISNDLVGRRTKQK